jgi:DNA-directed RNA polymerase specialized sigma subunit
MEYKDLLDDFFKNHTSELKQYFKKFATPKEMEHWDEMLSQLYLHCYNNLDKLKEAICENKLKFYCITYIYNQRNWSKTEFKRKLIVSETNSDLLTNYDNICYDVFEDEDEVMKKEIKFMEQKTKLSMVNSVLDLHQKILFQMYFIDKKSMRKIGGEVGLSHTAIHYMIQDIKNKIKNIEL